MSDLLSTLMTQFQGQTVQTMAGKIGASETQTQTALSAILPIIMNGLAKNASSPSGLSSLQGAIEKDHDGSILDNLSGLLSSPDQYNGQGILNHIFGQKKTNVENYVSDDSGLNQSQISSLMQIAAPIVLGYLGRQNRNSSGGIGDILSSLTSGINQQQPKTNSIVTQLLDSDNDGSIVDDVAELGVSFLGKFFK